MEVRALPAQLDTMSFDFVPGDSTFSCKNCGADIELWQYRRLALCEACEGPIIEAAKGSPEVRAQRTLDSYGVNWDKDFLTKLNDWDDKRGRLR